VPRRTRDHGRLVSPLLPAGHLAAGAGDAPGAARDGAAGSTGAPAVTPPELTAYAELCA